MAFNEYYYIALQEYISVPMFNNYFMYYYLIKITGTHNYTDSRSLQHGWLESSILVLFPFLLNHPCVIIYLLSLCIFLVLVYIWITGQIKKKEKRKEIDISVHVLGTAIKVTAF